MCVCVSVSVWVWLRYNSLALKYFAAQHIFIYTWMLSNLKLMAVRLLFFYVHKTICIQIRHFYALCLAVWLTNISIVSFLFWSMRVQPIKSKSIRMHCIDAKEKKLVPRGWYLFYEVSTNPLYGKFFYTFSPHRDISSSWKCITIHQNGIFSNLVIKFQVTIMLMRDFFS